MSSAGSSAPRRRVMWPYAVGLVIAVLAAQSLRTRLSNRFPYSGTWKVMKADKTSPLSFTIGSGGACHIEYAGTVEKETGCNYHMVEGSAIVEYVYNWRPPQQGRSREPQQGPEYGRTWYKAKLTPEENGQVLKLQLLDGADLKDGEAAGEARQLAVIGRPAVIYRKQ